MAIRTSIIALLCAASLQAAASAAPDAACVGTYRLHDGRAVDLALSGDTGYRWRMTDGRSGKLEPESDGGWTSTLGWTGREDGHRVALEGCTGGQLSFDGIAGARIAFDTIDTRFEVQGGTLAGRLVLPPGDGPVPLVVLVHGAERSSARDDYALQRLFPSAGIGAFVYDRRGTGGSGGHYTHDYLVLATDAIAAAREARRLAGARAAAIGYQAGSQGGWVAPLAARLGGQDIDAPHEETERRLRGLADEGLPIRVVVYPDAEHGMYEFELAPDGTRLSTRQPPDYFAAMRDFILGGRTRRGPGGQDSATVFRHCRICLNPSRAP